MHEHIDLKKKQLYTHYPLIVIDNTVTGVLIYQNMNDILLLLLNI